MFFLCLKKNRVFDESALWILLGQPQIQVLKKSVRNKSEIPRNKEWIR